MFLVSGSRQSNDTEIAPESLAYDVRGLNAAIADQLADCQPDDPAERRRYLEINGALTRCAELYSAALARAACVPVGGGCRGRG